MTSWRDSVEQDADYEWTGRVRLPKLAKLRIKPEFVEWGDDDDDDAGSEIEIWGEAEKGSGVTPEQDAAIEFVRKNEPVVVQTLLEAISGFANQLRGGGGWEDWDGSGTIDDVMPRNMTPKQAAERVSLSRLVPSKRSRDGVAYIEFWGECAWDPDHGFFIVLHRDRLVAVEQQGTGWEDEKSSGKGRSRERAVAKKRKPAGNAVAKSKRKKPSVRAKAKPKRGGRSSRNGRRGN